MNPRRRALLWAVVVAVGLGFAAGWFARVLWAPTPEGRARDLVDEMKERARRYTR
jgi:hypothetical protein